MSRTYKTEFPDFPDADMPALPAGWTDESWRNDMCPFLSIGQTMGVFVDYADATRRAFPENERYIVVPLIDGQHIDGEGRPYFATDDWAEVLAYVAAQQVDDVACPVCEGDGVGRHAAGACSYCDGGGTVQPDQVAAVIETRAWLAGQHA